MAGALDAFNANRRQALDDTQGMFDQATQRRAGGLLAGGDYTGAAGALYGGGLLSQGAVVQTMGENRAAGALKAKKESAAEAKKISEEEQAERLKFLAQGASVLLKIPQANRAQAYMQSIAPALKAMGADDATIQAGGSQLDDNSLRTFGAEVSKALEGYTLRPGDKRFGPNNELLAEAPFAPEFKTVGAGDTLVQVGPGSAAAGGPAAGPAPAPTGGVYDQIASIAQQSGAPEQESYLRRLAQVESNGRTDARNGSSTGVFQFQPKTFAEVGGGDINSLADQTKAALALARRDRQALQSMGIEPTDANTYIMHQQGAGGGKALLTAPPEVNAVAALTPVYGSAEKARLAITGNGGTADMSAGEFVDMWRKRWSGGGQPAAAGGSRVVAQGAPKPDMSPKEIRNASVQLRKEFNAMPDVKEFNDVANSYNTISKLAAAKPTGASDISFIFSYMKMLDPGSVVREGEFATAAKSGGVPDQVRNTYNRILNGERLTPQQRQNFTESAKLIYDGRSTRYNQLVKEYQGYASDTGLDPNIISPRVVAGAPASPGASEAPGGRQPGWSRDLSEMQRRAAAQFKGATGRGGTDANPFVPKSQAEYDALDPGAVYIHADGSLRTKGGK